MDKETLCNYYNDTMVRMDRLRKIEKASESKYFPEVDLCYGLSIINLIRNGVPFKLSHTQVVEDKKQTPFIGIVSESTGKETPPEPDILTIKDIDNKEHNIPCHILKQLMKQEYATLILKEENNPLGQADMMNISVPAYSEVEDNTAREDNTDAVSTENDKDNNDIVNSDENRLPIFGENERYRKDKSKEKYASTFLYNQHDIRIDFGEEGIGKITFYVYPLDVKTDSNISDIMVVAESGGLVRAAISRGQSSAVKIEYDQFPFIIRGRWKEGKFLSEINSLDADLVNKMTDTVTSHIPENWTSTTYFKTEYHSTYFFAFPARYGENESTGYALTAMAVLDHDNLTIYTPQPDGGYEITCADGTALEIGLYWIDIPQKLCCKIDTV